MTRGLKMNKTKKVRQVFAELKNELDSSYTSSQLIEPGVSPTVYFEEEYGRLKSRPFYFTDEPLSAVFDDMSWLNYRKINQQIDVGYEEDYHFDQFKHINQIESTFLELA